MENDSTAQSQQYSHLIMILRSAKGQDDHYAGRTEGRPAVRREQKTANETSLERTPETQGKIVSSDLKSDWERLRAQCINVADGMIRNCSRHSTILERSSF